jgi:cardiolipin synthase
MPNTLTVVRILLTPLLIIFLLREWYIPALVVFTIAGVSDGLDGFLARYFNQRTALGAYLDPIADKLLLMAAYTTLAVLECLPNWLAVVVISRDVIIGLGMVTCSITNAKVEINPSKVSKLTTVIQLLTIFITLLDPHIAVAHSWKYYLYWITVAVTILSGLDYIYKGLHILQDSLGHNQNSK